MQEQGLSSASVREMVEDVGDKVKDVVQQATNALLKTTMHRRFPLCPSHRHHGEHHE